LLLFSGFLGKEMPCARNDRAQQDQQKGIAALDEPLN
jgi:hypothetical protein